jgi:hypothetical protein
MSEYIKTLTPRDSETAFVNIKLFSLQLTEILRFTMFTIPNSYQDPKNSIKKKSATR